MLLEMLPGDREIAAILPEYTERGDCTRILLCDGRELLLDRSMRTTLRYLAARRCKSLGLMRQWAARYTRRRTANPVAIGCDLVLVPVKSRRPRIPGDNTLAQVNVALGVRLVAGPQAALDLAGGRRLPVLWSLKTLREHIAAGCHIHADLLREQQESLLWRLGAASHSGL